MKYVGSLILTALIALSSSYSVLGQNKIEFSAGYPATGQKIGDIVTKGKLTVDKANGWSQVGTNYIHRMWPSGGVKLRADVGADMNDIEKWGESIIAGLTSGTDYNVTSEITLFNNGTKQSVTVVTGPGKAKAK
jgi:hypothetical protein